MRMNNSENMNINIRPKTKTERIAKAYLLVSLLLGPTIFGIYLGYNFKFKGLMVADSIYLIIVGFFLDIAVRINDKDFSKTSYLIILGIFTIPFGYLFGGAANEGGLEAHQLISIIVLTITLVSLVSVIAILTKRFILFFILSLFIFEAFTTFYYMFVYDFSIEKRLFVAQLGVIIPLIYITIKTQLFVIIEEWTEYYFATSIYTDIIHILVEILKIVLEESGKN